jgi:hypothetical protein
MQPDRPLLHPAVSWGRMLSTAAPQQKQKKAKAVVNDDDEDDFDDPGGGRFPSEPASSSTSPGPGSQQTEDSSPPGMLFIAGNAAFSALIAVGVAVLGMAGMFWLGSYLSQIARALQSHRPTAPGKD